MFENWQGIHPIRLSSASDDYKNKQLFKERKCNKQTYDVTQKNYRVLPQCYLVPLGNTIKTRNYLQT